ncbi:hypothetical protein LPU83_pLPU83b_0571 (plasmid) [Rhizobium favelukesii]|uniref:Uncharacterized protein n=1 Tax=Rhizobium favelukesii TaxID=348824 RepID=W6S2A7_9HYPH|nr:hypothetical protein LPU83_pLPU83b_0571 [Rhizobium favelukesii]
MKILGLSGNVKQPSRTASLVEAIVSIATSKLGLDGQTIELVDAARDGNIRNLDPICRSLDDPENLRRALSSLSGV